MASAVLLIKCKDSPGLVLAVTKFIAEHGGNILELEQSVDSSSDSFFMRIVWDMANFDMPLESFPLSFETLAILFVVLTGCLIKASGSGLASWCLKSFIAWQNSLHR